MVGSVIHVFGRAVEVFGIVADERCLYASVKSVSSHVGMYVDRFHAESSRRGLLESPRRVKSTLALVAYIPSGSSRMC